MRIMPRARCIQYTCNGKTQNVLFFVDNEIIIVIIIQAAWSADAALLSALLASGILNSFSPQS